MRKEPYVQNAADYDYLLKVLLIGNSGVGKTCVLMRYAENQFTNYFYNTIGVDFKIKQFDYQGKQVKLQIWDTAGQDRFRTITSSYYRGAHGIMVIYDVTDRESFENVKNWMVEIDKYQLRRYRRFAQVEVNKVLIGNKADLKEQRRVATTEGQNLATQFNITFMETSAKTGDEIERAFVTLSSKIIARIGPSQQHRVGMRLGLGNQQEKKQEKTDSCCV